MPANNNRSLSYPRRVSYPATTTYYGYNTGMPPEKRYQSPKALRTRQRTVQFPASSSLGTRSTSSSDSDVVPKKIKKVKKMVVPPVTTSSNLVVYTDGAHNGVVGGVGVYFGFGDVRNVAMPLPGEVQTSQRAELYAAVKCLETAPMDMNITIVTDSAYLFNSMTNWVSGWIRNNWHKADGSPVLNPDLMKRLVELVQARRCVDKLVSWFKVPSHCGILGNEEADKLANTGVDIARAQRRVPIKL